MDPKSAVAISKSSNGGISKKHREERRTQRDKKSRSIVDFPHQGVKKRTVYVEKRLTELHSNGETDDPAIKKPPPRPRLGQKKFLKSVLTLLSKATTSTQCPEVKGTRKGNKYDKKDKYFKTKAKLKRDKAKEEINAGNKVNDIRDNKGVFKSRVLNKKFVREDGKKMVVLQFKREMAQTPSNYSECSYKDASQKTNSSNCLHNDNASKHWNCENLDAADDLKDVTLEGKSVKKVKTLRYLEDEPRTLVADPPKVQKNLYSIFVDLLETTISVCNVKAEYDATVSETDLKINKSVANKLNMDAGKCNALNASYDIAAEPQRQDVENNFDSEYDYIDMKTKAITLKRSKPEVRLKRRKLKTIRADSFMCSNKIKVTPKSKSVEINRRTKFKNKNDLINALKQELEVDARVPEGPQSIFPALKVMARNKKKISIHAKTFTDECVLMGRKIIPSGKSNSGSLKARNSIWREKVNFNGTDYKYGWREKCIDASRRVYGEIDRLESSHSLEVLGLDDEIEPPLNASKDRTFTYLSSNSDLDFNDTDAFVNHPSTDSMFCI